MQPIDLSPGDLLYYGGVEWLNISDFLGFYDIIFIIIIIIIVLITVTIIVCLRKDQEGLGAARDVLCFQNCCCFPLQGKAQTEKEVNHCEFDHDDRDNDDYYDDYNNDNDDDGE